MIVIECNIMFDIYELGSFVFVHRILKDLSVLSLFVFFFFFNDTATTEIYTLSLHDALPIYRFNRAEREHGLASRFRGGQAPPHVLFGEEGEMLLDLFVHPPFVPAPEHARRSEEHTSELQSLAYLVCRLLLEKKKK